MELKSKYDELMELANKLFLYTDARQWQKLQSQVFTEHVMFDMSSMGAGAPKKLPAKEICAMWSKGFEGIDQVHHQSGNFIIDFSGDGEARIFCYATATHFRQEATQGKTRQYVGSYELHASFTDIGWRLDSFRYNLKFAEGNAELK
jgi:hypothetical protein